jgi:hypothetical protein
MSNSQVTGLTVTCKQDFYLIPRLLESIEKYSVTKFYHYIILNDDINYLERLQKIVSYYPLVKIYHWEEIPRMVAPLRIDNRFGPRHNYDGWVSQIMLTLACANLIPTDYYLHLCSKDYFIESYDILAMIKDNRAMSRFDKFKNNVPDFDDDVSYLFYWINAYKFFDLNPWDYIDRTLRPETPAILITKLVNDMLEYLDKTDVSILDLVGYNLTQSYRPDPGTGKTIEYYLYSAWLAKTNNLDLLSDTWSDDRPDKYIVYGR